MQKVIWMYVVAMLVLAPISYFALGSSDNSNQAKANTNANTNQHSLISGLVTVASKPQVWLSSLCILTGYQLYWASYSFSAYMQNHYGMTAVAVGTITVASQWMRPVGAIAAGFAGDFLGNERVLSSLLVLNSMVLMLLAFLPLASSAAVLLTTVLCISLLTYGVRGIYWATIESCDISNHVKGLAIGLLSFIGFAPHAYLPQFRSHLISLYDEKQAYEIYFCSIAAMGLVGAIAAWLLTKKNIQPSTASDHS